jgi:hypothetical protein
MLHHDRRRHVRGLLGRRSLRCGVAGVHTEAKEHEQDGTSNHAPSNLVRSLLLLHGEYVCSLPPPLHELSKSVVVSAWSRTKKATEQAISLVRNEFGLVNMDILWSGALLVPVIAMCASTAPRERDPRGMAGWVAMAALLHRYSKAAETALDQDLRACRSDDPLGKLLTNVRRDTGAFAATPGDFRGPLERQGGHVRSVRRLSAYGFARFILRLRNGTAGSR